MGLTFVMSKHKVRQSQHGGTVSKFYHPKYNFASKSLIIG